MQRYINGLFLLANVIFLPLLYAVPVPEDLSNSFVQVTVYKNEEIKVTSTGIVVAEETVLTTADVLNYGRHLVVVNSTGAQLGATVKFEDKGNNLLLLTVKGLKETAVTFAHDSPAVGRLMTAIGYHKGADGSFTLRGYEGSLASLDEVVKNGGKHLTHNAAITKVGYGGGLFNNCNQLVAMNQTAPDTTFGLFGGGLKDPEGKVYALGLDQLKDILKKQKVSVSDATETCLTPKEQRIKAEAAASADAEEAARVQKDKEEQGKAEKKALEDKLKKEKKNRDKIAAEKEAVQGQLEQTQTEIEKQKKRQEELEREKEEARIQLEKEHLEAEVKRRQEMYIAAGIGLFVLIILSVLVYLIRRRKRAMLLAQQDAQIAQEHAGKASAALSAELKQKQRLQGLPNYILEGQAASGEPLTIKITGSDIGASGEGLVIGRNPDEANIILNLGEISRQQFRLLFLGDQLMIEDLDSTNGTQLNGELLTPYQPEVVFPGAVIDIAGLQMTIRTT